MSQPPSGLAGVAANVPKGKGIRRVSASSPAPLARKRIHDREAQRATRKRTREYMDRLQREVDELRSKSCAGASMRNTTLERLSQRNRDLENELAELKMRLSSASPRPGRPFEIVAGIHITSHAHRCHRMFANGLSLRYNGAKTGVSAFEGLRRPPPEERNNVAGSEYANQRGFEPPSRGIWATICLDYPSHFQPLPAKFV
ncbi:hypothetical protein VFPPC_11880 [Pochonia chlamydosporia 170]|uniref:BZIP transcription factor domain-containing protein n=1 Tax=Pochonia chlamydosporia 170 TaxID=1380566 RepID=A0A179F0F3_METCM|nr:hypothetical protein VFPPC_11880 [Pochonia chlamydosporia 170]OAQ58937.2 hypothetical protein VFPPC_11880 [Pochonia chlamydosporia 170]